MRIVGGTLAGRLFSGPPGEGTRPTSDRAREAIASAIEARRGFEGAVVLDLFAGTGAFSFEALSRGARRSLAVDTSGACLRAVGASARTLGLGDRVATLCLDVMARAAPGKIARALGDAPVDLVFLDPPWTERLDVGPLLAALTPALAEGALGVVVHAARATEPRAAGLEAVARYRYGDTAVVIYAPGAPDTAGPGEAP